MTAADLLKICREKAGISQDKLAAQMHRSQSDVSRYERGKQTIDITTFRDWTKITNHVEVGIAFLYGVDPATILQTILQVSGAA
ncbi:helix-turn-helix domain-containing protein [Paenibacillus sp. NRS-1760]|uniref:helix-turn-helix domain-containing protein n=1 Tax=Paenibacillus sp. NRS-1760 TaxID=3233902 RepID=UPI003D2BF876